MRGPRPIFAFPAWFVLAGLLPVFSSDTPAEKETNPPGKVSTEDDPLNPYVEGIKDPPAQPVPAKTRPPAKRKPAKAPKKHPGKTAPTAG